MCMYLYRIYGTGAGRARAFMVLVVLLRWLSIATEAKIPEPIIVDDEFVKQGYRCARAYGF